VSVSADIKRSRETARETGPEGGNNCNSYTELKFSAIAVAEDHSDHILETEEQGQSAAKVLLLSFDIDW